MGGSISGTQNPFVVTSPTRVGSSDKKHIMDSISVWISKKEKNISVQEYLTSGQIGCEEKQQRHWGKLQEKVKFLQFVEVCAFTYCLSQ